MKQIKVVETSEYMVDETYRSHAEKGNMYGKVLWWDEHNDKYIPIICGCGGSMWLCPECVEDVVK